MNASQTAPARTFIRTTSDGRQVEVIGSHVCLDGRPEADALVPLIEHPNRQAIQRAVPGATHMAGRLALTHEEAAIAQGALDATRREFDTDPVAIAERFRKVLWAKAAAEGVE